MNGPDRGLVVDRLASGYGQARILFDVSLAARPGEVVVLLGRNGAGKTTTLKTLMGIVRPRAGEVWFDGARIDGMPTHRIARTGLGYVPEDRRIFTELTVRENLEVGRQSPRAGFAPWTVDRVVALFPNLGEMGDRLGGRMSGGEQQMLTIARTLMGNPSTILLDEPSEGLAPVIVEQMATAIVALKREGLSVVLSEQNVHFAEAVSDRAYLVERGHIRWEGTMSELAARPELRQQYLSV
jgi:branched-chain amino acid transport system ATP-binding protein